MADLEAVLADVSYLMAMEKSKGAPGARAVKRMQLNDPRSVNSNCPVVFNLCVSRPPLQTFGHMMPPPIL